VAVEILLKNIKTSSSSSFEANNQYPIFNIQQPTLKLSVNDAFLHVKIFVAVEMLLKDIKTSSSSSFKANNQYPIFNIQQPTQVIGERRFSPREDFSGCLDAFEEYQDELFVFFQGK
jgi:hypothetical protein